MTNQTHNDFRSSFRGTSGGCVEGPAVPAVMLEIQKMDLQTFVRQSLQQAVTGVRLAEEYVEQNRTGAKINPRGITALQKDEHDRKPPRDIHTQLPVHQIEFDVAVTVSEASEGKAVGGLCVVGLGLGGHRTAASESSSVSRIKFTVPVVWPDPYMARDISPSTAQNPQQS